MPAAVKAIGYIRVSRVAGREGDSFLSPDLQRASIQRVCAREGLDLIDTYEELDASGGDSKRPKWNQALDRIERGEAQALVVWNLSRFSRSTADGLKAIERIEAAGGQLCSEEGQLGKLSRTILFAVAEDERDRVKAGFQRVQDYAVMVKGIHISAYIPFGYVRGPDRRLVPNPETAPIVQELFKRRINGASWTDLARWAAETHPEAPKTRKGIRDLSSNRAYLGEARGIAGIVNEAAHEPIISKLDFDKAAKREKPLRTGSLKDKTLLKGFVRCATCGSTMAVGWTSYAKEGKQPGYFCRSEHCSDKAFIRASVLDEYLEADLLERFELSNATMRLPNETGDLAEAEKTLEEAQYDLDAWIDNVEGLKVLGADRWNEKAAELTTIRNVAAQEVENLRAFQAIPDNPIPLIELWGEWSLQSRREFIDKMIAKVVLRPAHRKKVPVEKRVMIFGAYGLEGLVETDES